MFAAAVGLITGSALLFSTYIIRQPWIFKSFHIFVLTVGMVWCWGVWRATALEPATPQRGRRVWFRVLTRTSALLPVIVWLIYLGMYLAGMYVVNWPGNPIVRYFFMAVILAIYFFPFISPMLVCLYFRPLGMRARRPALRRLNSVVAALLGLGLSVMVTLIILSLTYRPPLNMEIALLLVFLLYLFCFFLGIFGFAGHRRIFSRALAGREAGSKD